MFKPTEIRKWTVIFSLGMSALAHAGGSVGSGGELIKDANNPWFLDLNTKIVRYCILVDRAGFSGNDSLWESSIQSALTYWKKEFSRVNPLLLGDKVVRTGSQEFEKIDQCDGSQDLTFKFGYSTLAKEDIEFLVRPRDFVGIAVRTDYDLKQLRGKGYIFIGSDKGPNRIQSDLEVMDNPWAQPKPLTLVLIHELGHVFGIPHVGLGQDTIYIAPGISKKTKGVMEANFPETIIKKQKHNPPYESPEVDLPPFFFGSQSYRFCNLSTAVYTYFNLPFTVRCLVVTLNLNPARGTYTVDFSQVGITSPIGIPEWIGRVDIGTQFPGPKSQSILHTVVALRLTREREVFRNIDFPETDTVPGAFAVDANIPGIYQDAKMNELPLLLRFETNSLEILGVINNKIEFLLIQSPSAQVQRPFSYIE